MKREDDARLNEPVEDSTGANDADVVPFPRSLRDSGRSRSGGWAFTMEVREVGGAEGEWLRRELAGVVRELLVWAHRDKTLDVQPEQPGEEEQAA